MLNQDLLGKPAEGVNFDALPFYIKYFKQFVMWKYEIGKSGKLTKPPFQIDGKRYASTTNAQTWIDLNTAQIHSFFGEFDGVGLIFAEGDDLAGIDIDNCLDTHGNIELWAQEILTQFSHTYIEISPSGTGFHILCCGKPLVTGQRLWKKIGTDESQGIEVYDYTSPRYFTLTGNRINANEIN